MINILFLHSGAELYGADQILINIVTHLDKSVFSPYVVLPNDGPLRKVLENEEINVDIIEYPIVRRKYFNPLGLINYIREFSKGTKKISEYVRENDIDIIHNNTLAVFEGCYIFRTGKIPVVFHLHEMIDNPRVVAKIMYKIAIKNSTKVIGVSGALKEHVELLTNQKSNIVVLHNGILDSASKGGNKMYIRDEFNIPKEAVVYGHIGRINAIKGQKDFVDSLEIAIRDGSNVYGLIVGDAFSGQEWRIQELIDYIESKKLSDYIKYVGFRRDMNNVYKTIDVLVLSSVQYDSFPTVVLEAMAYSKPVIAYQCGGVVEMVDNASTGYIVKQGDKNELAKKIAYLSGNIEKRNSMGIAGRKKYEKEFSIATFIRKMEDIYLKLLKIEERNV